MRSFTPSRLELAQRRRGLTKKELESVVSRRSLSAYEAGTQQPTEATVAALAEALNFPVEFFYGAELEGPPENGTSFRAMSRMTARRQKQALGAGALALGLSDWIDVHFNLPPPAVPQLRGIDVETAAVVVRAEWGLGERPIKNVIHLLEARGVRVFSLAEECVEVDAFSFWRAERPYVFLNTMKSAEHSRMDAAHELGHLVLHWRHDIPRGREYEHEAERFAAAFLMPRDSILADAPRGTSLDRIIKAKKIWKVSVAALVYRMHQVRVLSDWQYRTLFIELSKRGYRTTEPEEMQRETSQVLGKVFAALRDEGMSRADVARQLAMHPADLDQLIFGLVLTSLDGGQAGTSTGRPELRLI
jgi:Zn-dependent peptidase ImmA (M78 family)/transcriptional regulator with XRE-family HTH domain